MVSKATPAPSSEAARRRMKATRQRDTASELALRSVLHGLGLRYRVDAQVLKGLRRRGDVVFRRERVAVFVDGCFWHGCPEHGTTPKANKSFWKQKIQANRRRDADTNQRLEDEGWLPMRVWEHEDPAVAGQLILKAVKARRVEASRLQKQRGREANA